MTKVRITQIRSQIGESPRHRGTLRALVRVEEAK
jgi:ribosomal protein L30/L7E